MDDQILHPGSRALLVHWESLRSERPYPRREELDFKALSASLPDLVVIERDHLRKSFRFRLAGTRVCELFRKNLTGMDAFAGWDGFEADIMARHFAMTIQQFQPTLVRMRLATDTRLSVAAEFIGLPVQATASSRLQILGGFFPFREARHLGHMAIVGRELLAIRSIWTEFKAQVATSAEFAPHLRVIAGGLS